jgi:hypothetical protein
LAAVGTLFAGLSMLVFAYPALSSIRHHMGSVT